MTEKEQTTDGFQLPSMSDRELKCFSNLIYEECGIALSDAKKSMVSARLSKRLRVLGMSTFKEYYNFVTTPEGRKAEIVSLIDVMTTNTTEFFREKNHFDFLADIALPELVKSKRFQNGEPINVWSAGCSSGEEPYTIAMIMAEYFSGEDNCFNILATDISTKVLKKAQQAVYDTDQTNSVPGMLKRKYLMMGTGDQKGRCRVVPELRDRITFSRLNFLDSFDLENQMDIIFCRNALIYFDFQTKSQIVKKFFNCIVPDGYFFIGHSETLNGINDQFASIAPTIYRKTKLPTTYHHIKRVT